MPDSTARAAQSPAPSIWFTVLGIARPQGSSKAFMPRGARFPVVTSDNRSLKGWRQLVSLVAQQHAPPRLLDGPLALGLAFYLPRPKSLPKRVQAHTRKPDCDKLARSCL